MSFIARGPAQMQVSSAITDGDFARYVTDRPVYSFSSLPIAWIGRTEKDIYDAWSASLGTRMPQANILLLELIAACDAWRANQPPPLSRFTLKIKFDELGDPVKEEKGDAYEQAVDAAEERLKAILGETEWERYCNEARHLLRSGIHWSSLLRRIEKWLVGGQVILFRCRTRSRTAAFVTDFE
jgi:hypothetical protein